MAADVTGCSLPANTSKNNFFEAECNGSSDEFALASVCGLGVAHGARCGASRGVAAQCCAGPRSGLFHVRLLRSMAGCFCWQPMMAHTWAKRHWSLVQRPVSFGLPLAFLGGA